MKTKNRFFFGKKTKGLFRHAILPSDAISIEILPSFQIAIAIDSDNMECFLASVNPP
jgi:hypothetical protein